jgi:hypothetical protein
LTEEQNRKNRRAFLKAAVGGAGSFGALTLLNSAKLLDVSGAVPAGVEIPPEINLSHMVASTQTAYMIGMNSDNTVYTLYGADGSAITTNSTPDFNRLLTYIDTNLSATASITPVTFVPSSAGGVPLSGSPVTFSGQPYYYASAFEPSQNKGYVLLGSFGATRTTGSVMLKNTGDTSLINTVNWLDGLGGNNQFQTVEFHGINIFDQTSSEVIVLNMSNYWGFGLFNVGAIGKSGNGQTLLSLNTAGNDEAIHLFNLRCWGFDSDIIAQCDHLRMWGCDITGYSAYGIKLLNDAMLDPVIIGLHTGTGGLPQPTNPVIYDARTAADGASLLYAIGIMGEITNIILYHNSGGYAHVEGMNQNSSTVSNYSFDNTQYAVTVTANHTIGGSGKVIVNAASNIVNVTLPAASSGFNPKVWITKSDSSENAVIITPAGSDTIQGVTSVSLAAQYDKAILESDGVGTWYDMTEGGV